MNNVGGILEEEYWSEKRMKCEIAQCAGPCSESVIFWLLAGGCGFPFLAKRFLQRYLTFEGRFLFISVSTVGTSFYMGYRARRKCEENIQRLYAERREKALEKQREFENKKKDLEKGEKLLKKEES